MSRHGLWELDGVREIVTVAQRVAVCLDKSVDGRFKSTWVVILGRAVGYAIGYAVATVLGDRSKLEAAEIINL